MHTFTGFDIETKPVPELVEKFTKPFPEFDPKAIKLGNLKDPAKIQEKLACCKADHEADRVAYWKNAHDRAALNPFTGQIVVIGLINQDAAIVYLEGDEKNIVRLFWHHFTQPDDGARKFLFWSGCGAAEKMFDLDYIVTRSRILGVKVPPQVRNGRFYTPRIVDLASEFLLYQREQYLSLTKAAELFGLYDQNFGDIRKADSTALNIWRKHDGDACTGENFWLWYEGKANTEDSAEAQRDFALRYLANDLRHLFHLAPRIL